ncbi:sugar ABC transporter ATP-binding protein [Frankia sp. Cas4]|uniref:sugar ABC transporter ATP-binding protein n=1 Tax=Frankia sp. Cas4 TaxID=3073927 RepID=UPI002AD3B0C7|nr:sugar ABC transporter ATP-binding protein [Frankia sp. Cas4]
MVATPVLRVLRLSKTFPGQRALVDVDIDVEPGEVRALVGQNGCGKSTLIKILAGFHEPDAGSQVTVVDRPLAFGDPTSSDAAGLRFVHQDLGLVATLDTVDNLALGHGYETGRLGLIRWRQERAGARSAVRDLGYDFDISRPVGALAASERTAVAVARALSRHATPPRVLVLDEPTANLPAAEAQRLFALVRSVRDAGVAVIFVSHHLDEVFGLCDTVSVLRDGALVTTRPTAGLDEADLVELMIGRKLAQYDVPPAEAAHQGEVALDVRTLETTALRGVDLTVHSGEVVGVAGLTGSGREELALALFGGCPRAGVVAVAGKAVPQLRPDLAMRSGMGLVPAERHANAAFLDADLQENVVVASPTAFSRRGLLRRGSERSDVARWLDRLNVAPAGAERAMSTLSGGNQQKVVLARWLRREPRVLVLDEPTQGVDIGAKAEIHALVDRAAADGAAVVVVSTDHDELARLCGRVLVLAGGRVVDELHRADLHADRITAAAVGHTLRSAS